MALTARAARRQRAVRLARLRGRAVHAADGHHLRAAGVRAGAGLPVGGAVRPRQALDRVNRAACRSQRHAVAGARPRARSCSSRSPSSTRDLASVDARRATACASSLRRCKRAGRTAPAPIATRCARSATRLAQQLADADAAGAIAERGATQTQLQLADWPTPPDRRHGRQRTRETAAGRRTQLADAQRAAARRHAAADRRARQDGAGRQGHARRRSCPTSRSWRSRTAR